MIQRKEINHALASNLFWINIGLSPLLTTAFAAAGSLLAWFYCEPWMAHVAAGMSVTRF